MENPTKYFYADYSDSYLLSNTINRCINEFNYLHPHCSIVLVYCDVTQNTAFSRAIGLTKFWKFGLITRTCNYPQPITRARMKEFLSAAGKWVVKAPRKHEPGTVTKTYKPFSYPVKTCPDKVITHLQHSRIDAFSIAAWTQNPDNEEWVSNEYDSQNPHHIWIKKYETGRETRQQTETAYQNIYSWK